jgi:choline-sulfatase
MRALLRLTAFLGLTLAACGGEDGGAPAGTPVVLISIDTLRSDHLPAYGYKGVETPAIDALRRDSILYERAYSHVPLTLPSHVSLLSGQLPTVHGVRDNAGYRVPESGPWLPAALRERGYATGGVVSAYVLRGATGFARGFDFYEDGVAFRPGQALGGLSRPGGESLRLAVRWLRSLRSPSSAGSAGSPGSTGSDTLKPFFLFLHLYEPHMPYQPPAPFAARYAASPYDGEIAAADRVVGELTAELRNLGLYERALIVLLSDHGEGLGDHGEEEHGIFVYRESLQVPLLVKLPGGERAGTSVAAPVQLADVYPTVAELAGLPHPEGLPGASLTALPPQGRAARRIYAESYYPRFHYGWSELLTLIDGRHQYIQAPEPELYDLAADPAGRTNRLLAERRAAGTLRQALAAEVREPAPPSAVDAETRQSLAALGYAAGSSGPGSGPLPDPKRRIQTLAGLRTAFEHFQRSRFAEAVPAFERALAANPRMLDGWDYYGRALQQLGRFGAAQAAYEKALEISGGDPDYALAVAAAQLEQGQVERALATVRWARSAGQPSPDVLRQLALRLAELGQAAAAVEILGAPPAGSGQGAVPNGPPGPPPPDDADQLAALGLALSAAGRQEEARDRLLAALALDAGHAAAHENLGLVMLRLGRFPEARDSSRRAVEIDPGRANAWNNLGVALYQTGDRDGALAAWARAVEIDPRQFDTLYNLGIKAAEAGRFDQARWALRTFAATAPPERYAADLPRVREMLRQLEGRGR